MGLIFRMMGVLILTDSAFRLFLAILNSLQGVQEHFGDFMQSISIERSSNILASACADLRTYGEPLAA